jgi:hypothetical protein
MDTTVDIEKLYDRMSDSTVAVDCPDRETAQSIIDALLEEYDDPFETTISPLTDDDAGTVDGYRLTIKKPWYSRDNGWFTTDPAFSAEPYSEFAEA